jgi:hypothetical protein
LHTLEKDVRERALKVAHIALQGRLSGQQGYEEGGTMQ